jgi:hypothetical protein
LPYPVVVCFGFEGKIKVLPVYFLELLMCSLASLPLVYMVFAGNCLAPVETQWAGDVPCDFVTPK